MFHGSYKSYLENEHLEGLKDNFMSSGKIIKIEEPTYATVYEVKKEILDKTEKRYLSNVIRPFRDKVKSITKTAKFYNREKQYICIKTSDADKILKYTYLPSFRKNKMYKGMEINKEYSLEELGL